MAFCRIAIIVALLIPGCLCAQVNRYVVHFTDKTNSPYSVDHPDAFLTPKSLMRRHNQGISINEKDLPVNPSYVSQVKGTGARIFYSSRWMNCLLVEIGADSVSMIQALPMVTSVEYVAPGSKLSGGRVRKLGYTTKTGNSLTAASQLEQIGVDKMQAQGFHGENITIAMLDAGFIGVNTANPFQHLYQNGQIKGTFDFVGNTGNVYQYHWHGTETLSLIGAITPGLYAGGAHGASFYLFVTEDVASENRIEEYNWVFGAEKADSLGVDIISSSLGYFLFDDPNMNYRYADLNGFTTVVTRAANEALARGMVVVNSAGNEGDTGWHYIIAPSDAPGILSCGGVDDTGVRVSFSSAGPSSDNRIKPDVVALGYGNAVIDPDGDIVYGAGTSFSAPLIASLVAGVWQAYPYLTNQQVYKAVIQSGDQASHPDNLRGYGLPNFPAIQKIVETEYANEITIHPNPTTAEVVTVTFAKPQNEPVNITIFDSLGRTLSQSSLNPGSPEIAFQLSLYGVSPGIYYVQFRSQSVNKTLKLIKV